MPRRGWAKARVTLPWPRDAAPLRCHLSGLSARFALPSLQRVPRSFCTPALHVLLGPARGAGKGPADAASAPLLGRGPHGVGEQEESIRIMKPQPATHRGGTRSGAGAKSARRFGAAEPARPGGGGGRGGGSAESEAATPPRAAPGNRALATGRPEEILKPQRLLCPPPPRPGGFPGWAGRGRWVGRVLPRRARGRGQGSCIAQCTLALRARARARRWAGHAGIRDAQDPASESSQSSAQAAGWRR